MSKALEKSSNTRSIWWFFSTVLVRSLIVVSSEVSQERLDPGLYVGWNYCQSHVWVDMWMLTVRLIYKLSNCAWWPEMGYKHTFDTIYTHFQGITNNIYGFGRPFFAPSFLTRPPPVHPYFCPSIFVFTRPNDGWTGLYIKLWRTQDMWIVTCV